jgi:hypothetical protein
MSRTWSLTLKKKTQTGRFKKRRLGRIFGSETEEQAVALTELFNEGLAILDLLISVVTMVKTNMRREGHVARKRVKR